MWVISSAGRTLGGATVRALGHALAGAALAAGPHHAATDSAVSWSAVAAAVMVLTVCAYSVLRADAHRMSVLAPAGVQALLPTWLRATGTDVPATALDGHLRLPAAWHHNTLAMSALNFLAALPLGCFFRSACRVPARLSQAVANARCWWVGLLYVMGLALRLTGVPLSQPQPARPPWAAAALPKPRSLTVLLYRAQPCAP